MADVTISGLPKAPDNIYPTLVPVSNGTNTFHLSAFSAPYSNGTGSPGVQGGTFRNVLLRSNNTGGCWIGSLESNITSNTTNYTKAAECDTYNIKIASGVRDGGYKIGLGVEGYITNSDFKGTLAYNYGIWCRHGFYSNAEAGYLPTGTIENSYGIIIDTLSGTSGAKINNCWGIYQPDNYGAKSKNYLEGDTGIGVESPLYKLHVRQTDQNKVAANISGMEFGERSFTSMQANTWYDVSRGDIHGMYIYKLSISGDIGGTAYRYHEMGFNKSWPSFVNTVWGKNTGFPSDPGVEWQLVNVPFVGYRYQVRITNSSWSGTNASLSLMGAIVGM